MDGDRFFLDTDAASGCRRGGFLSSRLSRVLSMVPVGDSPFGGCSLLPAYGLADHGRQGTEAMPRCADCLLRRLSLRRVTVGSA